MGKLLKHLGFPTNLDDARRFVEEVDFGNRGVLDFREFIRLMRLRRQAELAEIRLVFDVQKDECGHLPTASLKPALKSLGYRHRYVPVSQYLQQQDFLDFDAFVDTVDQSRRAHATSRRKKVGFSYKEIEVFREVFMRYDLDGSGSIEREELTHLIRDLELPWRTTEDQRNLLTRIERARASA